MVWYYVIYQEFDKYLEQHILIIKPMPDLVTATTEVELHPEASVIKGIKLRVIQKHIEIQDNDKVQIP